VIFCVYFHWASDPLTHAGSVSYVGRRLVVRHRPSVFRQVRSCMITDERNVEVTALAHPLEVRLDTIQEHDVRRALMIAHIDDCFPLQLLQLFEPLHCGAGVDTETQKYKSGREKQRGRERGRVSDQEGKTRGEGVGVRQEDSSWR
jgi:hypothetical protein